MIQIGSDTEDEIIEVNKSRYSLRKILDEDGWQKYLKMSEKAQAVARFMVRLDLSHMELAFARVDNMLKPTGQDTSPDEP